MINTIHLTISELDDDRELVSSGFPTDQPPQEHHKIFKIITLTIFHSFSLSVVALEVGNYPQYKLVWMRMCST